MNPVIYFVYNEPLNAIKIGKADDFARRMADMQVANAATLTLIGTVPYVHPMPSSIELRCTNDLRMF